MRSSQIFALLFATLLLVMAVCAQSPSVEDTHESDAINLLDSLSKTVNDISPENDISPDTLLSREPEVLNDVEEEQEETTSAGEDDADVESSADSSSDADSDIDEDEDVDVRSGSGSGSGSGDDADADADADADEDEDVDEASEQEEVGEEDSTVDGSELDLSSDGSDGGADDSSDAQDEENVAEVDETSRAAGSDADADADATSSSNGDEEEDEEDRDDDENDVEEEGSRKGRRGRNIYSFINEKVRAAQFAAKNAGSKVSTYRKQLEKLRKAAGDALASIGDAESILARAEALAQELDRSCHKELESNAKEASIVRFLLSEVDKLGGAKPNETADLDTGKAGAEVAADAQRIFGESSDAEIKSVMTELASGNVKKSDVAKIKALLHKLLERLSKNDCLAKVDEKQKAARKLHAPVADANTKARHTAHAVANKRVELAKAEANQIAALKYVADLRAVSNEAMRKSIICRAPDSQAARESADDESEELNREERRLEKLAKAAKKDKKSADKAEAAYKGLYKRARELLKTQRAATRTCDKRLKKARKETIKATKRGGKCPKGRGGRRSEGRRRSHDEDRDDDDNNDDNRSGRMLPRSINAKRIAAWKAPKMVCNKHNGALLIKPVSEWKTHTKVVNILNAHTMNKYDFTASSMNGGNPRRVADEIGRRSTSQWPLYGIQIKGPRGAWIKVDLGSKVKVESFAVSGYPGGSHKPKGEFYLEGSNNDKTWTRVAKADAGKFHTGSSRRGYPFPNHQIVNAQSPGEYRYYRIRGTSFTNGYMLVMNWGMWAKCQGKLAKEPFCLKAPALSSDRLENVLKPHTDAEVTVNGHYPGAGWGRPSYVTDQIDRRTTSRWNHYGVQVKCNTGQGHCGLVADLKEKRIVRQFAVSGYPGGNHKPKGAFYLEGSNDSGEWTRLAVADVSKWQTGSSGTYPFKNHQLVNVNYPGEYRYYRIVTSGNSWTNHYMLVMNWGLFAEKFKNGERKCTIPVEGSVNILNPETMTKFEFTASSMNGGNPRRTADEIGRKSSSQWPLYGIQIKGPHGAWLKVDLQKPTTVVQFAVSGYPGGSHKPTNHFFLEGSKDGQNWKRVATAAADKFKTGKSQRGYPFRSDQKVVVQSPEAFRFYRLRGQHFTNGYMLVMNWGLWAHCKEDYCFETKSVRSSRLRNILRPHSRAEITVMGHYPGAGWGRPSYVADQIDRRTTSKWNHYGVQVKCNTGQGQCGLVADLKRQRIVRQFAVSGYPGGNHKPKGAFYLEASNDRDVWHRIAAAPVEAWQTGSSGTYPFKSRQRVNVQFPGLYRYYRIVTSGNSWTNHYMLVMNWGLFTRGRKYSKMTAANTKGFTNILNVQTMSKFEFAASSMNGGNPRRVADQIGRKSSSQWPLYGIQIKGPHGAWLSVDLGKKYTVKMFAVSGYPGGSHKPTNHFFLEGSNDGQNWKRVGTAPADKFKVKKAGAYPFKRSQIVVAQTPGAYQFYRIRGQHFTNGYMLVMNWGLWAKCSDDFCKKPKQISSSKLENVLFPHTPAEITVNGHYPGAGWGRPSYVTDQIDRRTTSKWNHYGVQVKCNTGQGECGLVADLKEKRVVRQFAVSGYPGGNHKPKGAFYLEGSNDSDSWTRLAVADVSKWQTGSSGTYPFKSRQRVNVQFPGLYRYYRIVTSGNSWTNHYMLVMNWGLFAEKTKVSKARRSVRMAVEGVHNILNPRSMTKFAFTASSMNGGNPRRVADEIGRTSTSQWPLYGIQIKGPHGAWLRVDLKKAYTVTEFAVSGYPGGSHKPTNHFFLEGSTDGSNWKRVATADANKFQVGKSRRGFPFSSEQRVVVQSPGAYRFYRLRGQHFTNGYMLVMNWGLWAKCKEDFCKPHKQVASSKLENVLFPHTPAEITVNGHYPGAGWGRPSYVTDQIDRRTTSRWNHYGVQVKCNTGQGECGLVADLKEKRVVRQFAVSGYPGGNHKPKGPFYLEGSNDSDSWTRLAAAPVEAWQTGSSGTYPFKSHQRVNVLFPGKYRYYRIVTSGNSWTNHYMLVMNWGLFADKTAKKQIEQSNKKLTNVLNPRAMLSYTFAASSMNGGNPRRVADQIGRSSTSNWPLYGIQIKGPHGAWLSVDLKKAYTVRKFAVSGYPGGSHKPTNHFFLEGSTDGSNWKRVATADANKFTATKSRLSYPFSHSQTVDVQSPGAYRFYRLRGQHFTNGYMLVMNWGLFADCESGMLECQASPSYSNLKDITATAKRVWVSGHTSPGGWGHAKFVADKVSRKTTSKWNHYGVQVKCNTSAGACRLNAEFKEKKKIRAFAITGYAGGNHKPKGPFYLEGSNDGNDWFRLQAARDNAWIASRYAGYPFNDQQVVRVEHPVAYKYYRIAASGNSWTNHYMLVMNWGLFE